MADKQVHMVVVIPENATSQEEEHEAVTRNSSQVLREH
jgi:hypothetical protein